MWRLEQPPAATAEGSRDDGAPASAWVLPYWARVSRRRDDWWWWWWRRVGVWAHYLASRRRLGSLSLCLASLSRVASTSGLTISLSRLSISLFSFFFSFFPSSFTFSVRFTAEFSFLIFMGHGLLPPGLAGWAMGCCYQMPIAATKYLFTNSFILNYFKNSSKWTYSIYKKPTQA